VLAQKGFQIADQHGPVISRGGDGQLQFFFRRGLLDGRGLFGSAWARRFLWCALTFFRLRDGLPENWRPRGTEKKQKACRRTEISHTREF
jgi:hypothetical protein